MLVNFRVENFNSFKDLTEFSMEATKLKNLKESNVFDINNISLLKSAVVYGANASGKSNFLMAINKMRNILSDSINIEKMKKYVHQPFLLNTKSEKKETFFEMEFIINEILYRYGFIIEIDGIILEEHLFQKKLQPRAKEVLLFQREKQVITIGNLYKEGKSIDDKTRDNALFISVVAQFNGELSKQILQWFAKFNVISNLKKDYFEEFTHDALNNEKLKEKIINFIKNADVGIYSINNRKIKFEDLIQEKIINNDDLNSLSNDTVEQLKNDEFSRIETQHMQYNEKNEFIKMKSFDLDFESDGTQILLALSGPIIDTLLRGGILAIDELDNSLHTELVEAIVKIFNSNETNPNNAQLIFTTHDTNLLNQKLFRRDQIWFTQKNIYGSSELYSLVEYGKGKGRDDLVLEKNYLEGKFGARPHINSLVFEVD